MFDSLRWKFTALYVVTSVLAVLVLGGAIFYAESRALNSRLEGSIRGAGDAARAATAANLARSASGDPTEAAVQAVETVVMHRGLNASDVHVVLLDENGMVRSNPEGIDAAALGVGGSIERARADGEHWHTARVAGTELRVKTFPLTHGDDQVIGYIQAAKPLDDNAAALRTLFLVMAGSGALGLVLFAVGGYFVAGKAIEPVQAGYERQRQFVADASHELRTPLTVIRTNVGLLLRRKEPDQALVDIESEARYMSQLLDNLLTLARGDRGQLEASAIRVDLAEVARSAASYARALSISGGLSFRESLEAVVINADPDICRQAIFILVDNAAKYAGTGSEVVLSTRREGHDAIVEVRDNGAGMTSEELAVATERFHRGARARTRVRGGAGLGLSIAKELMKALNGALELESKPGAGTTARLRFRLAQQVEASKQPAEVVSEMGRLN
jgi:signal transduction histidine kinase